MILSYVRGEWDSRCDSTINPRSLAAKFIEEDDLAFYTLDYHKTCWIRTLRSITLIRKAHTIRFSARPWRGPVKPTMLIARIRRPGEDWLTQHSHTPWSARRKKVVKMPIKKSEERESCWYSITFLSCVKRQARTIRLIWYLMM